MASDCRWSCALWERHGGVLGPSRDKHGSAAQVALLKSGSLTPGVNGCVAPCASGVIPQALGKTIFRAVLVARYSAHVLKGIKPVAQALC